MVEETLYWQQPQFLNDLINQLPAAIFWKNTQSVFLGCNEYFAKLAQISSPTEIINKTDFDMPWSKFEAESYRKDDQEVMHRCRPKLNIEETQTLSDGQIITLLTNKIPLIFKNEVVGILGIFHDITELKNAKMRAEQALLAQTKAESAAVILKAKAEKEEEMRKIVMVLVGDIVHDLRTPIATIRTISSLLSDIIPNMLEIIDDARELGSQKVNLISKKQLTFLKENQFPIGLNDATALMDEFINSSLVELDNAQKEEQSHLNKCSSRRVLERALEAYPFDPSIKRQENISYDFELMGNSILIMKILFNLFKNAVEQIHENKKGEIIISTEDSGNMNLIKVKDTAGGVSPEVLPNLFKQYFTTKQTGTGIGLSFSKEIMKRFDGDLTYENHYGESVEFILSFPKLISS